MLVWISSNTLWIGFASYKLILLHNMILQVFVARDIHPIERQGRKWGSLGQSNGKNSDLWCISRHLEDGSDLRTLVAPMIAFLPGKFIVWNNLNCSSRVRLLSLQAVDGASKLGPCCHVYHMWSNLNLSSLVLKAQAHVCFSIFSLIYNPLLVGPSKLLNTQCNQEELI